MKNIIYFILIGFTFAFNLNSLSVISRKEILKSFSKISFLPILLERNNIDSIQNSENIFPDEYIKSNKYYDSNEKDEDATFINTINNNIYFYSPITKSSCFELEKNILNLNHKSIMLKNEYDKDPEPINLHIQSSGGSLLHSIYIIDLIQSIETPVYTYIDGFAASAATLISVVGKKRYMTKNSLMLIHQLSGGMNGKFFEMKDENENIDALMNFIIKTYLENTKIKEEQLQDILKRDIWLNSSFCLKNRLVDEII
tara:strand:+ start:306 stop:1073 length:768 start_codon:yes stop_codon:yes gene_type:complete